MKSKRTSDGRKLDHTTLQALRQRAVKAIREGRDVASVAAANRVNERSVYRWLADFANGGQKALLAKPIPGRPAKVSAEEMRGLAQAVRDHTPLQFKFEFGLWTLSQFAVLIEQQFGKKLALSGVSRIMKLLGFTTQKALYQAWQQDATLVQQGSSRRIPRFEPRRELWEQRSTLPTSWAFARITTRARHGHRRAKRRWSKHTGRRFSLNMISAVSTQGEFRSMVHDGTVTAVVFREFLSRLMFGADKPIFLVLDGLPIHKAKLIQDFVKDQKGRLKLFYLPPYAPHLNPDEQVWAHVKRNVSKRLVQTRDEMKRLAIGSLRRIQKLPELVKSFFRQPECQHAAM